MRMANEATILIPEPESVRVELARSVRETQRLRELLKVAERTRQDRSFIEQFRSSARLDRSSAGAGAA